MNSYIWITLVLAGVYVGFMICAVITYRRRTPKPQETTAVTVTCSRCVVPMVRVLPDLVGIEGVQEYLLTCVGCGAIVTMDCRPNSPVQQEVRKLAKAGVA